MRIHMIGSFVRNAPFGTEIAFKKGLHQLGVEVHTWDPSHEIVPPWNNRWKSSGIDSAHAMITFKDHGDVAKRELAKAKSVGIPTVIYQPDDVRAPGILDMMIRMRDVCDFALTFDKRAAEISMLKAGYRLARRLLVTADPDVYHPYPKTEKDIDFCFVGSMSNPELHKSRRKMVEILRREGYNVVAKSTFDVKEINELYNRSKVVLNHATDVGQEFGKGYGYQCRHFEAGMAGAALLTNYVITQDVDGPEGYVDFYDEEDLIYWARLMMDHDGSCSWESVALTYWRDITHHHTPMHRAREIIDFVELINEA